MDSCFDLVESRQHDVASYEVFSWSTDIHILIKMVMTSDETQISPNPCQLANVTCKTRDNWKNPEYRLIAAIRKQGTDINCPTGKLWHGIKIFSFYCVHSWRQTVDVSFFLGVFCFPWRHALIISLTACLSVLLGTVSCSSNNQVPDRLLKSNLDKSGLDITLPNVKQILVRLILSESTECCVHGLLTSVAKFSRFRNELRKLRTFYFYTIIYIYTFLNSS